jgi:conjugative relaxase-like TrwC/TraI family protein
MCQQSIVWSVLIVNPIGEDAGRYYRPGPGRWLGGGTVALGLAGAVHADVLQCLLRGRHPDSGGDLLVHRPSHRRAGWDLVLAAPKSVSLLVAMAPPARAEQLAAAHAAAAADAVEWLQQRVCWARRGGVLVGTDGLVAAGFDHRRSASGDPHVHTHMVLVNATRAGDGVWSALDSSSLWVHRGALGAVYHLALRRRLEAVGVTGWRLEPDGSFDLSGVPRRAIDATSRREAEIRAALAREEPTRAARRAARGLTRAAASDSWWPAAAGAGLGPAEAASLGQGRKVSVCTTAPPAVPAAVATWLAARRSTYSVRDLLVGLAATTPGGASPDEAQAWAEAFARRALPAAGGRITTPEAATLDRAVAELVRAAPGGLGLAAAPAIVSSLGRRPELCGVRAAAVERLTRRGEGVVLLDTGEARDGFFAQASVLDAAREAWAATGHSVAVRSTPAAARRWAALAAVTPEMPDRPTSVLIVDRADRLAPAELLAVLRDAGRTPAKVVLLRGGSLPALSRACSEGMETIDAVTLGAPAPPTHSTHPTGPVYPAGPAHPTGPAHPLAASPHGTLPTGAALAALVDEWQVREGRGVLVGLGPAEVAELNRRARAALRSAGVLEGPDVVVAGRSFAVGDRVVPLRREVGRPGAEGRVVAVGDTPARMVVEWGDGRRSVDSWAARRLGHAYALTPAGLRLHGGAALLLGEPEDLGRDASRVVLAVRAGVARPTPEHAEPSLDLIRPELARRPSREPARDAPGLGR